MGGGKQAPHPEEDALEAYIDDENASTDEGGEPVRERSSRKHDPNFVNEALEPPIPFIETGGMLKLITIICFLNAFAIGMEVDFGCMDCPLQASESGDSEAKPPRDPLWGYFDYVFSALFVIEIGLKMQARGPFRYFKSQDKLSPLPISFMKIFEILVVLSRILDIVINQAGINVPLRMVSMVRVYTIMDISKGLKQRSGFRELFLIAGGIHRVAIAVAWVFVLLFLLMWAFACVLTVVVGKSDNIGEITYSYDSDWLAPDYWSTVPRSVYTLFQVLTLDRWSSKVVWPVVRAFPATAILFMMFLCLCVLSLCSIIVGIIVENTMNSAKQNEAEIEKQRAEMSAKVMSSLQKIFDEADTDASGELDRQELRVILKRPHVKDRLKMLELPPRDLDLLFTLLDGDSSGAIATDVFFRGCTRMRGQAMACDLHQLSIDLGRNVQMVVQNEQTTTNLNATLAHLTDKLDSVDRDIIKAPDDNRDEVLMARRARVRQPRTAQYKQSAEADAGGNEFVRQGTHESNRYGSKQTNGSKRSFSLVRHAISTVNVSIEDGNPNGEGPTQEQLDRKKKEFEERRGSNPATESRSGSKNKRPSFFTWQDDLVAKDGKSGKEYG